MNILGGVTMQNERKRILAMLENGTITTDEALTLLENLSLNQATQQSPEPLSSMDNTQKKTESTNDQSKRPSDKPFEDSTSKKPNEQASMEEFLEDLRTDFTNVGDRFMQFMQTAVQKVKSFDFETPFGNSVVFQHTATKEAANLQEVIVEIDNGKLIIHPTDENVVRAEFTVKTYNADSEESAKAEFLEKLLFVNDEGKIRISSDLKMMQVNVELFIPQKDYQRVSARLLNGSFKMKGLHSQKIRVKTANGKIEVSDLTFDEGEFETANGAISLLSLTGRKLEAEALNGRVYIDGALVDVEAQSLNGHVVVTTTNPAAEKIEAKTMSGSVEIYVPSTIALSGEIASNMGRLDLQLNDINRTAEQEQLLHRTIRFKKDVEGSSELLHIFGEAKTGSVLVCYNATHE